MIVALAVLVCGGGGAAVYLVAFKDKGEPSADASQTAGPTSTRTSKPTPTATSTTRSPTPASTEDAAKNAATGDCLANDGTDTTPKFRKTSCSAGTFTVL